MKPAARRDFEYAAANAGMLAARGGDARLLAGARSTSAWESELAVRALKQMLVTLRLGYARGPTSTSRSAASASPRRAPRAPGELVAPKEPAAISAADCMLEARQQADAGALANAFLTQQNGLARVRILDAMAAASPVAEAALEAPRAPARGEAPEGLARRRRPRPRRRVRAARRRGARVCRVGARRREDRREGARRQRQPGERSVQRARVPLRAVSVSRRLSRSVCGPRSRGRG